MRVLHTFPFFFLMILHNSLFFIVRLADLFELKNCVTHINIELHYIIFNSIKNKTKQAERKLKKKAL